MKYTPSPELLRKVAGGTDDALQKLAVKYRSVVDEQFIRPFEDLSKDLAGGLSAGESYQGVKYPFKPLRSKSYIKLKSDKLGKSRAYVTLHGQRRFKGKSGAYVLERVQKWKTSAKTPSYRLISVKGGKATVELSSGYDLSSDPSLVQALLEGIKYPTPLPDSKSPLAVVLYSEYKPNMLRPLLKTGGEKFQKGMVSKLNKMFGVRSK
jgi:hypothetical protein